MSDTDAKSRNFVEHMSNTFCLPIDLDVLNPSQKAAIYLFREKVLTAAHLLYKKVPEDLADPVLRNFFTKLVDDPPPTQFVDHMAKTLCLPRDLENLNPSQKAAVYLFRQKVLDAAVLLYRKVPEDKADPVLRNFFTKLVRDPHP